MSEEDQVDYWPRRCPNVGQQNETEDNLTTEVVRREQREHERNCAAISEQCD
jgi:hypothetical protein